MGQKILYSVFGPFKVPKMGGGDDFEKKAFWKEVGKTSEDGLSDACGCYIISVREKVWYVGLANNFGRECFTPDKQLKFSKATARGKGDADLYLVARTTPGRKFAKPPQNRKELGQLEDFLIMHALRRNIPRAGNSVTK